MIKKGLPINELLIPVDAAKQWLGREGLLSKDGKYISQKPRSTPGFDNEYSFAKRIGVDPTTVYGWIKKGLPINELGLIPVEAALRWVEENPGRSRDKVVKAAVLARKGGQS